MDTIRAALEKKLKAKCKARLKDFRAKGAPQPLIDGLEKKLAKGNLGGKVGKVRVFGDLVFTTTENKKYRRGFGVVFTVEDGSKVYLIPGPYGLFLTNVIK